MPEFKLESYKLISAAVLFVLFLMVFIFQAKEPRPDLSVSPTQLSFSVQSMYSSFTWSVSNTARHYFNLLELKGENQMLKKENQVLRARLATFEDLKDSKTRLEELAGMKPQQSELNYIVTRVTAKDLFTDHYSLLTDAGLDMGIHKLMGVVTGGGVVGYITDVSNYSSRILLATDRLSSIDAVVQRTRARGIVSGQNSKILRLKYIERANDIKVGDTVITSPDQPFFPKGYPIGKIISVYPNPTGVGHQAEVLPFVELRKLQEVIIVGSTNKGEE